jgi:hypothetical protein
MGHLFKENTMLLLRRLWFITLLMVLLVACNTPGAASTTQVPAASDGNALLQVITPAGTTGFSLSDLQKLPATTITVDGKPQDGPTLLDVLQAAKVTDFKEVTLSGSGSVTLAKDQVTREVILDFTNRGTVKFAALNVPKENWPKDITTIEVK